MEELLTLVSRSTLNHNSDNKKLVNDIDLFFRNICLTDEQQEQMMWYIDQAYITGNIGSRPEESEGDAP